MITFGFRPVVPLIIAATFGVYLYDLAKLVESGLLFTLVFLIFGKKKGGGGVYPKVIDGEGDIESDGDILGLIEDDILRLTEGESEETTEG